MQDPLPVLSCWSPASGREQRRLQQENWVGIRDGGVALSLITIMTLCITFVCDYKKHVVKTLSALCTSLTSLYKVRLHKVYEYVTTKTVFLLFIAPTQQRQR